MRSILALILVLAVQPSCTQENLDSILKDASLCSFVMMPTSLPGPLSGSDPLKLNPDRMVRDLIELGLDPNEPCPDGGLPLHVAIFVGNREMIDLLLELGADVNAEDPESGFNAVVQATILNDPELAKYLESRGGTIAEDVRVSATKVAVHMDVLMAALDAMPDNLSPAEQAQYEYDASIKAQLEALEHESDPQALRMEKLWLEKASGRKYDPDSGADPNEWKSKTMMQALREAIDELEASPDWDPEKFPKSIWE